MRAGTAKLRNGPVDPREALATAAAARGDSLAALSRMLDRRSGYLSDFVRDGVPRALTERDDGLLSAYFGKALGVRDLWAHA
jgi:repressor LexA